MVNMEQEKLVMNYINDLFQFRKKFNHKLSNNDITNLIHHINYKLNKSGFNIDEKLVHNCMINFGFRVMKTKNNDYIFNVGIKPPIQKLLKLYHD